MHRVTDLTDRLFKDAVRARVRHHQCAEHCCVLRNLRREVVHVDVAVIVARNDHHAESGHHRTRRVRPVRTARDQADGALRLVARVMPATNGEESRVLALRACVRLQADGGETGDLREPRLKVARQLRIPRKSRRIGERMHVGESWVPNRLHLRGGVQLHRATTERDHGARQTYILLRESEDVSKHLALRAVQRKDWVSEDRITATQHRGERIGRCVSCGTGSPKDLEKRCNVCIRREFVTCKTDARCVQTTEFKSGRGGGGKQFVGTCGASRLNRNRIKEVFVAELQS